jgi:hypothetical protein
MTQEESAPPVERALRRHRKTKVVVVLVAVLFSLATLWVSNRALLAPRTLDLWGHNFNADGNGLVYLTNQDPAWPNEPISYRDVLARDPSPIIVHQTSGPLLLGLQIVPLPKPSQAPRAIYLQVGSDAYVPYYLADCGCEPTW